MYFQRNSKFSAESEKNKSWWVFLICLCAAQLFCASTLVCDYIFMLSCFVALLYCHVFFVVLPVSFCSDFALLPVLCLILSSHVLQSRFGLAPSAFNLSYDVLFCSCRYRLPLCVAFSFRFLRVVFCRSLLLSRFSALRVSPAETRLTVYRRLSMAGCKLQAANMCWKHVSQIWYVA